MNRISQYVEESPNEEYGDYYIVTGHFGAVSITNETAARIDEVLDRASVPEWIVFDDRAGSRVRVRTCQIRSMVESTAAQRAEDRRFDRARQREEQEDRRPWEGYD
jgi:hypothetical protein